jgi:hypothetical protein
VRTTRDSHEITGWSGIPDMKDNSKMRRLAVHGLTSRLTGAPVDCQLG